MPRAILSVSDKTGLVDFARGLTQLGWDLVSTGGTARALRAASLDVQDVSAVTGHPEMMDGRVKTLHPAIHAGILARRDRPQDGQALAELGYGLFDMVVVNLYPFRETVAAGAPFAEILEKVDIGGPTLLRAAAKNHADVIVIVDPADYAHVLAALRAGGVDASLRRRLAGAVFRHTARYDDAIAAYFAGLVKDPAADLFPSTIELRLERIQALRYGENPDQAAAFYGEATPLAGSLTTLHQLHGKELSFNNLLDVDAAMNAVSAWADETRSIAVVVKHTTPCGVSLGDTQSQAYEQALAGDPVSAFGGIVAFNEVVSGDTAEALASTFLEIVVAPDFTPEALTVLQRKKSLRLLALPAERPDPTALDYKRVRGGFLVQQRMHMVFPEDDWRVVTRRAPNEAEWRDLRFAWRVAATVKSNAIVLARDERTLGIGAGQMSRVDASRISVMKARDQQAPLDGAVLASDAFFPFRDGVDAAAEAGIAAVIEPGGSVRDEEVITAANEHGIAMVFTGRRVFRH